MRNNFFIKVFFLLTAFLVILLMQTSYGKISSHKNTKSSGINDLRFLLNVSNPFKFGGSPIVTDVYIADHPQIVGVNALKYLKGKYGLEYARVGELLSPGERLGSLTTYPNTEADYQPRETFDVTEWIMKHPSDKYYIALISTDINVCPCISAYFGIIFPDLNKTIYDKVIIFKDVGICPESNNASEIAIAPPRLNPY
ncbi:MAG: hypothetical protein A2Y97_03320 [Nitrospirae bacterium RBG_13_39_12]|nr:MAG: hypothetical protein A2Y97_03320 [Nitrospirae bacterium RBG_13_39_12]